MSRASWDEYFLMLAEQAAKRSTCSRLSVGAVVVQNRQVVSTGYNGSAKDLPHCDHTVDDGPCRMAVHAEANALIFAGLRSPCYTRELYITHAPCFDCAKLILNAEIDKVVYRDVYRSNEGLKLLMQGGVYIVQLP